MKQNERILVYLVTGFLAVILVVAVFFGRDSGAATKPGAGNGEDSGVRGLGQMLDQRRVDAGEAGDPAANGASIKGVDPAGPGQGGQGPAGNGGVPSGAGSTPGQSPLVATVPVPPAERVEQLLGESRRDRTVRIVRARAGDSLESLVLRWCGKRNPYLEEATALNEQLSVLRIGQEVVVPWVDDETVLAAYEARQPRLLAGRTPDSVGGSPTAPGNGSSSVNVNGAGVPYTPTNGSPLPAARGPSFQVPGTRTPGVSPGSTPTPAIAGGAPAGGTVTYTVKSGDSLWKIAAKRYGARNADRMIRAIKALNGLADDQLDIDQQLLLPAAE